MCRSAIGRRYHVIQVENTRLFPVLFFTHIAVLLYIIKELWKQGVIHPS